MAGVTFFFVNTHYSLVYSRNVTSLHTFCNLKFTSKTRSNAARYARLFATHGPSKFLLVNLGINQLKHFTTQDYGLNLPCRSQQLSNKTAVSNCFYNIVSVTWFSSCGGSKLEGENPFTTPYLPSLRSECRDTERRFVTPIENRKTLFNRSPNSARFPRYGGFLRFA